MLREQAKLFNNIAIVLDIMLVAMAFLAAYWIRGQFRGEVLPFRDYVWILLPVLPVWYFLLAKHQLYASIRRLSFFDIITRLANVHLFGGLIVAALIYFFDKDQYSRGLYLLFLSFSYLLFVVGKISIRISLGLLRTLGYNYRNILIVGTEEKAKRFYELVKEHSDWGLNIVGCVRVSGDSAKNWFCENQVIGSVNDIVLVCKTYTIDEVVFCMPKDYVVDAEEYVRELEELGITVRMVLDFYGLHHSKKELSFFHNELPILTFHVKAFDSSQLFLKRTLDILGAVIGLFITGFLLPFIAVAIKMSSKGPIFFGQKRVGENGRIFKCWKFRSMLVDAEELKKELLDKNEMKGAIFKIKDDPRITSVGKFLRKTSLDELPQFWNVLKGEMSLVGTRPPTPDEVAKYENWHRRRICIKPGITGMWQVSGRNKIENFDEIVRLDLSYIDKWTLWLDIRLILKTFVVVFARKGSC